MKKIFYACLFTTGLLVATSCIDDKYDLDDIDTTTAIKINDLTVPVNLSTITLDDVLDIEEDGLIGVYTNDAGFRYYAIKQKGEFTAQSVKISELRLTSNVTVNPQTVTVNGGKLQDALVPFSYLINNVDESLVNLSYFGLNKDNRMEITLSVSPASVNLTNVEIQLPQSYEASYNNQLYSGGVVPVTFKDGKMEYPIYIESMTFDPVLAPQVNDSGIRYLNIADYIGFKNADLGNYSGELTFSFVMSPFSVNVVNGEIDYEVDMPEIQPVELNDLPEFLTSGDTKLILENPQLYLDFTPLFGANYNTSLYIYPVGVGTEMIPIENLTFQEGLVLAPNTELENLGLPINSANTVSRNVPELRNILKGEGLPESIQIEMGETSLDGKITNLILGTDEGIALSGSYTFFTPLAFSDGSEILYQKKEEGFFGDDVENVLIRHFRIESNVISQIPTDVTLSIYPLDKSGSRIPGKNGYISGSSTVSQGASKLDLEIKDEFNELDGLEYVVEAKNMNGVSLSPDQTLTLNDIRVTISGEYVTKL